MTKYDGKAEFEEEYAKAITKQWPTYSRERAVSELYDYIGARYGHSSHTWDAASARDIARQFMQYYGEIEHG